ncbi:disulfide bond formation protein DsbA [Acidimicrobiia bacterium EGI L10123]|uniref:mycothiol-dependent nitroreductase Rv2466c family protein n=1 Tax=Salinilacustrithrix flava TaxID=2957203 RepID=UPI003D7C29FB|nr:disulfide bond formation protein DsbA [Acidimicrobiia bacterium EGI L10123]
MTARWVVDEVAPARDLQVTWQPISLFFKNEPEEGSEYHEPVWFTHRLLRVLESVRSEGGDVEQLYLEYGRRIHHDKDRDFDVADALDAVGLDVIHAKAFDDDAWDAEIRTRMDIGLALCGDDVGTPIIAMDDKHGNRAGYFGPVITRVPDTETSLELWDALRTMISVPGFWELKRTRTEKPDFGDPPTISAG